LNAFDVLSGNDPEHVQRLREKMNLWRPIQTEHCLTQLPRRKAILSVHHLAPWSRELGINPKTVANWRKRATVGDMKTGPTEPRAAVLTKAGEAMVVAFRALPCCRSMTSSARCSPRSRTCPTCALS
jgi:hypothetical protein